MISTLELPLKHGMLTKRSINKSKTTFKAKFQSRWFRMTTTDLNYSTPNGKKLKGSITLTSILGCEHLDRQTFNKPNMFQIMYNVRDKTRTLYLQASSCLDRDEWMSMLRTKITYEQDYHHKGAYLSKKWSCCGKDNKQASGCTRSTQQNSEKKLLKRMSTMSSIGSSGSQGERWVLDPDDIFSDGELSDSDSEEYSPSSSYSPGSRYVT